jgi:hypothetical protein
VASLLGWSQRDAAAAIETLADDSVVASGVEMEGEAGEWVALRVVL